MILIAASPYIQSLYIWGSYMWYPTPRQPSLSVFPELHSVQPVCQENFGFF